MPLIRTVRNWIKTRLRNAVGFPELQAGGAELRTELRAAVALLAERQEQRFREAALRQDLQYRDLMLLGDRAAGVFGTPCFRLVTQSPVAVESHDHKFPWGTLYDNTRWPRFVAACQRHFQRPVNYLDLGCAGGGLVLDFLLRGHRAMGLEGSNVSLLMQRAEWRLLPHHLFTCDVTRPFRIETCDGGGAATFDVITAWELLEHIAQADLPNFLANVRGHLAADGYFVGSIATVPDGQPELGAVYHVTVKERDWWEECFRGHGLEFQAAHPFQFADFCRGTGNGPMDGDFSQNPHFGFHFVSRLR